MPTAVLRISVLASGSKGNALLVEAEETRLLVDAGIAARRLEESLAALECAPESLDGILLTHEHEDHARGLKVFCKRHGTPVYTNKHTSVHLDTSLRDHFRFFSTGNVFHIGPVQVHPFQVPHDAAEPVGFHLSHDNTSFAVLTDLGYATRLVEQTLHGVNAVLVEANHDEDLLRNDTKRPPSVKQRITSRHGHLSNRAASALVRAIASPSLTDVLLAHLSGECNTPELARAAFTDAFEGVTCPRIHCPGTDGQPLPHRIELA